MSIPYVDAHIGHADGIIDPKEYAYSYTDSATGVTVYLEHNSTVLYVGLSCRTQGWIALGWKNPSDSFILDGLNRSDLIYGYAPGTPHHSFTRVTGAEAVSVEYKLYLRNGTLFQTGTVPDDTSTTPLNQERLLKGYIDGIIGMRIGEERRFIIPAEEAYTNPTDTLYGEDLEYVVKLTRIGSSFLNPASYSKVIFRDDYGTGTFSHLPDTNQSRVLASNASDDGVTTQIEYFLRMNSTDSRDIPFLNETALQYPMIVMFSGSENIDGLPTAHTDWSAPLLGTAVPNEPPEVVVVKPVQNSTVNEIAVFELNATDEYLVRRAAYKIGAGSWTALDYDFATHLWTARKDLSSYGSGTYMIWFNATDSSNKTSVTHVNVTIDIPITPLRGMKLSVGRTVSTLYYHELKIADEFTVENNGSAPISAIEFYIHQNYTAKYLSASATDQESVTLSIVRLDDRDGMMHFRVLLASPVGLLSSYKFTVTVHYHSTQVITDAGNNLYQLDCLRFPLVPYPLARATLTFAFRSGDTLQGTSPEGVRINVAAMSVDPIRIVMKSYTPLVVADRITQVRIDSWGWLYYTETITLQNTGPAKESRVPIVFPAYASSISIYDEVGLLAASLPKSYDWNASFTHSINLKADRFGDKEFWPGYKYTFKVDYVLHLQSYQETVAAGNKVELPMVTLGEILVTTHVVDVLMPAGVTIIDASPGYRLLYGAFDATLRYVSYNTSHLNPPELYVIYQVSLATAARPLLFSLLIGLVGLVFVVYRKTVTTHAVEETDLSVSKRETGASVAPPALLSEFASKYSNKTALALDLEKLEAERKRGKVSKKEFMMREQDLKAQMDTVESRVAELREQLIACGPKYRDLLAQLELQEERIAGAKAGLRQLLARKKTQKISRAAFEKSHQDYLKTIRQAVSASDRILMTLREEAGEI
ncbi:MAG: FKBP-type peptidyl-prolyl cis-trans isomerase [Candidatus Thorarchaeota archaeon]|nr:FKBP-type peptidyl-prolyl cis-trans isomerase [Candidatus Thorarchaeota archaeon]